MDQSKYDNPQSKLMDLVRSKLGLRNDAALSKVLEVTPSCISNLRSHKLILGSTLIIRINETTDMPIREIKALAGQTSLKSISRSRVFNPAL